MFKTINKRAELRMRKRAHHSGQGAITRSISPQKRREEQLIMRLAHEDVELNYPREAKEELGVVAHDCGVDFEDLEVAYLQYLYAYGKEKEKYDIDRKF